MQVVQRRVCLHLRDELGHDRVRCQTNEGCLSSETSLSHAFVINGSTYDRNKVLLLGCDEVNGKDLGLEGKVHEARGVAVKQVGVMCKDERVDKRLLPRLGVKLFGEGRSGRQQAAKIACTSVGRWLCVFGLSSGCRARCRCR